MSTKNPRHLASEIILGGYVSRFVLILKAETEEFEVIPSEIGADPPYFLVFVECILGPVEPHTCVPVAIQLLLSEHVGAPCVLRGESAGVYVAVDGFKLE